MRNMCIVMMIALCYTTVIYVMHTINHHICTTQMPIIIMQVLPNQIDSHMWWFE